jgi:hypothetical protein
LLRGNERKRRKRAGGEGRLDDKDENDRGKDGTKRKAGDIIITGIGAISGNIERGMEEWLEREIGVTVNVKEAFKIDKGRMMLAKIESWEQKKDIMLNKSELKEKKR